MSTPLIAIIDWAAAPQGEPSASIEKSIVGDVAQIKTFLCTSDADFNDEILGARALIVWHNTPVRASGIEKLKNCRAIIRNGVGFDSVDIQVAARCNIAVCNVPDYGTEEVADHAIALSLALCRQLFPLDAEAKNRGWTIPDQSRLRRLSTLTFGIIGLGRIGTATALRAKAFGFDVRFFDPILENGADKALGITREKSLENLLAKADVLSVHCPLNTNTHHLISTHELKLMKPSAFVVNTARGAVIKKDAILTALRNGTIAGAALDVIEDEPLKSDEEASTPNLIVTPHAAFYSVESKNEMRASSARIARAAVLGEELENVVNSAS